MVLDYQHLQFALCLQGYLYHLKNLEFQENLLVPVDPEDPELLWVALVQLHLFQDLLALQHLLVLQEVPCLQLHQPLPGFQWVQSVQEAHPHLHHLLVLWVLLDQMGHYLQGNQRVQLVHLVLEDLCLRLLQ